MPCPCTKSRTQDGSMLLSPLLLICAIALQTHDATSKGADAARVRGDDKSAREALLLEERPRAKQRYLEILSELNGADFPNGRACTRPGRGAPSPSPRRLRADSR